MDSPTLPHSVFVGAPVLRSTTPHRGPLNYESSSSYDNIIGSLGFNFKELEKDLALIEADATPQAQHVGSNGQGTEITKLANFKEEHLLDQYESVHSVKYMSQNQELLALVRRCEDMLAAGKIDALQKSLAIVVSKLDSSNLSEMQQREGSNTPPSPLIRSENKNLRVENMRLKLKLKEQQAEVESNASNMKELTSSAMELSILEAEEINKLENELAIASAEISRLEARLLDYDREQDKEVEGRLRYYLEMTKGSPLAKGRRSVRPGRLISEEMERKDRLLIGYQKREAELVAALEGLIRRCKELELEKEM